MSNKNSFRLVNKLTGARVMFLTFLFLGTFLLSCSKNEPDEISNIVEEHSEEHIEDSDNKSYFHGNIPDDMMDDYDLWNKDIHYDHGILGKNNKYIFFYTCVDNKLIIKGFDTESKKKVFYCDNINLDTDVTLKLPYGAIRQFKRKGYIVTNVHNVGDTYTFFLHLTNGLFKNGVCYFNIINKENCFQCKGYDKMKSWYNNSFILHSQYGNKYICFSFDGKKEFELPADNFYDCGSFRKYWPVNMNEGVFFNYSYNSIKRMNIKTREKLWESEKILSDLPKDIRRDETTFKPIDDSFISLAFKYTFYDGTKGERKYKVDIKSGKLTLL